MQLISRSQLRQLRWQFVLAVTLTILFVAAGLWFFHVWNEPIRQLKLASPATLVCVAALQVVNVYLRCLYLCFLTARLGQRIKPAESYCLTAVTNLLGLWTLPALAVAYRGAYLHWKQYLKATDFAAATAVFGVSWVFVSAATGSGGVLWTLIAERAPSPSIILLYSCLTILAAITLIVLSVRRIPGLSVLSRRFGQRLARWRFVSVSREIVLVTILIIVGLTATNIVGMRLIFVSFELPLGVREAVLMGSAQQLGALIALTPGGFGFQEGASLLFLGIVESDLTRVFVALAVLRALRLAVSLVLGTLCWPVLLKRRAGTRAV